MRAGNNPRAAEAADSLLRACLRGDDLLPDPAPDADLFRDRALHHGLHGLLMKQSGTLPTALIAAIRPEALAFAMWDLRHRGVLVPLLRDLAASGVRAVVLKGTALAYSLYDTPGQRPRGDTDLLIAPDQRTMAAEVLRTHGFRLSLGNGAERMSQEEWHLTHEDGSHHAVDLHWNLLKAWALNDLFDTMQLLDIAIPLPRLAPEALALPPPIALIHACVHRASHFSSAYFTGNEVSYDGDRLIWLHDIRLLADTLSVKGWEDFIRAAVGSQTTDICLEAMQRAQSLVGASLPEAIAIRLADAASESRASVYFTRNSLMDRIRADLAARPKGQSRTGFLWAMLFPPPAFMREHYPNQGQRSLMLLYLHRFRERLRRLREERLSRKRRQS